MTDHRSASPEIADPAALRVGFFAAILTAVMTALTFGFAIVALPNSGEYCLADCLEYPYLDSLSQYPIDYRWMYLAILQVVVYLVFMIAMHAAAPASKKFYSLAGLAFALMAGLTLLGDYFVQVSVVPLSLMKGETEGIALLTQYNPNGLFIVLEELGYLLMALSFVFFAPVFGGRSRLEGAVRWIFIAGFVLALAALALVSFRYGLERQDRFEIMVISIDWLVLLVNGILVGLVFRRRMRGQGG